MSLRGVIDWVVEYLTLRSALRDAERMTRDRREALRGSLEEARQRREAAGLLVERRMYAEAIRLATASAEQLIDSASAVRDGFWGTTRTVRRGLEEATWALAQLSPAPAREAQVTRAQRRALGTLLGALLPLDRALREASLDRRGLATLRVWRAVTAMLVLGAPIMALVFVKRSFLGPTAKASSVLNEQYAADRVLDGDPDTEWAAGGGDEWLELRFRSRVVHTVRVLNGHTLANRSVQEFNVDFYSHRNVTAIATMTKTFDAQVPAQWQTIDAGGIRCDRVRITVKSHYGSGAAIADVTVD
jgi:hypothetical protein